MNKVEQRQSGIMEVLSTSGRMEVTALARRCNVSLVTIRKDLTKLEERGLLKREQGCAVLCELHDMRRRLADNYSVKRMLAKAASDLVADGDTVMIESGSCCILAAEEISKTKKNVTIVTNSVFMSEYIGKSPNIHLVLLGGDYQPDSQAVVGPVARMGAQAFHVKLFFAGTDGYRAGTGFTGDNHLRVETLKNMAENAEEVAVITESEKFVRQGVVPLFSLDEVRTVITDSGMTEAVRRELAGHEIRVIDVCKNK